MTALAVVAGHSPAGPCVDWYTAGDTFSLRENHVAAASPAQLQLWAMIPAEHLPQILGAWEYLKAGLPVDATHLLDIRGVWGGNLALTAITNHTEDRTP